MTTVEHLNILTDVVRALIKNHNSEAGILMRKIDTPVDGKAMEDAIGALISSLRLQPMGGVIQEANVIRSLFNKALRGEV